MAKTNEKGSAGMEKIRVYEAQLISVTSLLYSKPKTSSKITDETHEAFERRTWQEKVHVDKDGHLYIPGVALQKSLPDAAKRRGEKIPGRGASNYTARFKQGVAVEDFVLHGKDGTALNLDAIDPQELFVPLQPQKIDGPRGMRVFPVLRQWQATVRIVVFDGLISEQILVNHLQEAGMFLGLGAMRVAKGHNNGRFELLGLKLVETRGGHGE